MVDEIYSAIDNSDSQFSQEAKFVHVLSPLTKSSVNPAMRINVS